MSNETLKHIEKHRIFAGLIDQELPRLRAVAYRFLGHANDADEVIQSALLKAWQKFDDFKNESKLSSWVYRIVINECHEIVRKQKVENKYLKAYADNRVCEGGGEIVFSSTQLAALRVAIASLPELYRVALTVGFLSDLSIDEAAHKLCCSVNTLYQRIHKAKELVKREMGRA